MASRATRLQNTFNDVIHGRRALEQRISSLFVDGLCMQSDAADCLYKLNKSKAGLPAIQIVMRMDLSPDFINGPGAEVLALFRMVATSARFWCPWSSCVHRLLGCLDRCCFNYIRTRLFLLSALES